MATTLPLLLFALGDRLQDTEGILTPAQRERAVTEAAKDLVRFRPLQLVADLVGNGTSDYALPAGWALDISQVLSIEYPAGEVPPIYLEDADWVLYRSTTSTVILRLLRDLPSATQTIRLLYTGPHTLTTVPATTTLNTADEEPLLNKAASLCCTWLAAYYAQQGQASLSADVTNHESKARTYRDLAKDFQRLYNEALGIDTKDGQAPVRAASAVLDWDNTYPWGEDRLTHPRRWY